MSAAQDRYSEADRLWNDHLRRLGQLEALAKLLAVSAPGDFHGDGMNVLAIAADLAEQCHRDFAGQLLDLAVKGARAARDAVSDPKEPMPTDFMEMKAMARRAWQERGIVILWPERIKDRQGRQCVLEVARTAYGKREGGVR